MTSVWVISPVFGDFTVKTAVAVAERSVQKVIRVFFNGEFDVRMIVV